MSQQKKRHRILITVAVAATAAAMAVPAAVADPPHSSLVASKATVLFDISGQTSDTVNVGLDSQCQNVFQHHQTIAVGAVSENTHVATVSPDVSGAVHCGGAPQFTISTYSYAANPIAACNAVATGATNIDFSPISSVPGLQKQLSGTQVGVLVTDIGQVCSTSGLITGGGGDTRPAAPGVANGLLNADPSLVTACKTAFATSKNAWRGAMISAVTVVMPKPESVKEDTTQYPTADDWINHVATDLVYPLCSYTAPPQP